MRAILGLTWALALAGPAFGDVLGSISQRGEIRLGVRADAPPFSYLDENTEPAGLAVRLCEAAARRIADELGQPDLVVRHRVVTSAGRFPALMHGETDLHCGPASATLRRRETLDFSILYFVDGAALAARPGGYETVFETGRGDFGVLEGTTTVAIAEDLRTRNEIDGALKTYPSHRRGLSALAKGEIDMYVGDQSILLFQIEALELADEIAVREDILSFEPYALVMRRGEDRLRLAVDRALSSLYDDGSIYRMIREELGDYPLSPEARSVYQIVGLPQ